MPVRNRCGICVEAQRVTRPVAASKAATAPRVSKGTADCRPEVNVNSTTCCAVAKLAAISAVSKRASSISVFCAAMSWTQRRAGCQRLVKRHDRRLSGDLDRDLFGEVFGLSGGVADHRSDWLTDIGHALMREDRLRYRDIIGAIETRTDRFHSPRRAAVMIGTSGGAFTARMRPRATGLRRKRNMRAPFARSAV